MVTELGAERALVLLPGEGDRPEAKAIYGFETSDIWSGEIISTTVLQKALKKGQSVMLMDAPQDFELGSRQSIKTSRARSVICAPIFGSQGEVVGLLYADDRMETARFDYSTRDRLTEFGQDFSQSYQSLQQGSPVRAEEQNFAEATPFIKAAIALFLLALLWATAGVVWEGSQEPPPPSVKESVAPPPTDQSRVVAEQMLRSLQAGTFPRHLLTPTLNGRVTDSQISGWLEKRRDALAKSAVVSTSSAGSQGTATVQAGTDQPWNWTLIKRMGIGWKIDHLGGDPLP